MTDGPKDDEWQQWREDAREGRSAMVGILIGLALVAPIWLALAYVLIYR